MTAATPVANTIFPYTIRGEFREHPERFTEIHQLEVNEDTHETIEIAIDPAVYRDDWDNPWEEDLNHYLHCNDRFYNDRSIMKDAVFLNDRRFQDPNFRKHQVERSHNLAKQGSLLNMGGYFIYRFCRKEFNDSKAELGDSSEGFRAKCSAINESRREIAIKRMQREDLEAMNPIGRRYMKFLNYLTSINEKIVDFVGDKNNSEAQTRRNLVKKCVDGAYAVGTVLFIRRLLRSG